MLYKNISSFPVFILQNMIKTLVKPGDTININEHDINHSGSSMRFFESLAKHKIVKENGWHKPDINNSQPQQKVIENIEDLMERNLL